MFAQPAALKCFGIAVFSRNNQIPPANVSAFFTGLVETLKELGMPVSSPKSMAALITYPNPQETVENVLKRAHGSAKLGFQAQKVDMIFCVLVGKTTVYADVKRYAGSPHKTNFIFDLIRGKAEHHDPMLCRQARQR